MDMTGILQKIIGFFSGFLRPKAQPDDLELQAAFRTHYRHFRELLTANNNALEIMAEMETACNSGQPFSMGFVRGQITAMSVNVFKMIRHLIQLSDNKRYNNLLERFRNISKSIETIIADKVVSPANRQYILDMDEIDRHVIDQTGEKMANLGELRNHLGIKTPDGFVITAAAARYFMEQSGLRDEINRRLKILDINNLEELHTTSAAIQKLISNAALTEELDAMLSRAYYKLARQKGKEVLIAMRSSALGEDGIHVSFAGQYRTQLNVDHDMLGQTYKDILAGKHKSQAIIYRQQRGYRHQDVVMCVGCLEMVDAKISGVAYSRDPGNSLSDSVVIHTVHGLAIHAVEGDAPFECYHVSRQRPHQILSCQRSGACRAEENPFMLSDIQAAELAGLAIRLEEHFSSPQDIEWSIDNNNGIVILQSRSLSSETIATTAPQNVAKNHDPSAKLLFSGGITVSKGAACGPVFKVNSTLDMLRFPDRAVLVIKSPYPDWAVLLNRATAVVSNTGQAATHLATVAREFGIPAIFNTENTFELLDNDAVITVDATDRRIYEGKLEKILENQIKKNDLMTGSPIYMLLKQALTHITPLNLTDPGSPHFRISACQTLHDITRYCHEKAVQEMFDFGSRYGFDDRAARQLVVDAPFQWWVINLDDGFCHTTAIDNRFVRLEDIQSEPMLDIWKGITAVAWEGPPPVSLSGFGAILFQSTKNPHLDPAVRSNMAARNYFLISKNFCNLSVRLGYHFALVEANLSEFLIENYLSFQFKGGAADERRRLLRLHLLWELLEQYDFRVDIKGDALRARIEKQPKAYLKKRLVVLGYLLIHTRQIDMVTEDTGFMERLKGKIANDLNKITGLGTPDGQEV